jgi:hypothetical protein
MRLNPINMKHQNTAHREFAVISNLKDLPLTTFIECYCHQKYELLAVDRNRPFTETEALQIQNTWMRLMSDYSAAKVDEWAARYVMLQSYIDNYEFRKVWLGKAFAALQIAFIEGIAESLRTDKELLR